MCVLCVWVRAMKVERESDKNNEICNTVQHQQTHFSTHRVPACPYPAYIDIYTHKYSHLLYANDLVHGPPPSSALSIRGCFFLSQHQLPSLINIDHDKSPDLLLSVESFISPSSGCSCNKRL